MTTAHPCRRDPVTFAVASLLLGMLACGGGGGDTTAPPPAAVAAVVVSPSAFSVGVGASDQLTAVLKDAAGQVVSGRTITWASSAATIASVNGTGLVTGLAAGGPVTITASSEGRSGSAQVTVTSPVASVSVSPATVWLGPGQTQQFSATVRDASNNVLTGRNVTWSTSGSATASHLAIGPRDRGQCGRAGHDHRDQRGQERDGTGVGGGTVRHVAGQRDILLA